MTENELLEALSEALGQIPGEDDAYTTRDLAEAIERNKQWVRDALRKAIDAGTWECVRVKRLNLAGINQMTIAYRPVSKKGGK